MYSIACQILICKTVIEFIIKAPNRMRQDARPPLSSDSRTKEIITNAVMICKATFNSINSFFIRASLLFNDDKLTRM